MNSKIKVSVIIPIYNVERYLNKCITSVLDQTLKDIEIVLVNDGSTDGSYKIIEEYENKYKNIKVINKENGGLSSARNAGLEIAEGKYITFLDSDDYIMNDYLENLYVSAEKNNSDMAVCGQYKVDRVGNVLSEITYPVEIEGNCVLRKMNIAGKLYRNEYLQRHNIRFGVGKIYEDNPFNFVALFLAKNIVFLQYAGYCQVVREGSITAKKIVDSKLPYIEIENAIKYVLQHEEEINDKDILEFTLISFLTYFIFQANKSHGYMKLKNRKSDWRVVDHFCMYSMEILNKYFPNYYKNKYIGPVTRYKLAKIQKIGTWGFVILCRTKLLKMFARIYYIL